MTPEDLKNEVLATLTTYWRVRGALAFFKHNPVPISYQQSRLQYTNVPLYGDTVGLMKGETVQTTLDSLNDYVEFRLCNDLFIALIARMELFLSDRLTSARLSASGTFGQIQRRAEAHFRVNGLEVDELDEVRARRNAIIHHHGKVTTDYKEAALKVVGTSHGHVPNPNSITCTDVSESYLSYATDVLIRYARKYP